MSNQKCPDCGQEIAESSMAHSCPGPAKAEQANRRERFASTTFRALPHAQTPEGMLEAKDAEIAALRAENEQLRKDLVSDFAGQRHELIQLRAECAMKNGALASIEEYWNRDPNERAMRDACEHAIATARDALAPSDAGKKWAAMAQVCEIMADAQVALHDDHVQVAQLDPEELFAALRELEK